MNVEGWRGRIQPKKRWIVCVIQDMREMDVSDEMTIDREKWNKKCCADPKSFGTEQKDEEDIFNLFITVFCRS
jgi:hypothetical protein